MLLTIATVVARLRKVPSAPSLLVTATLATMVAAQVAAQPSMPGVVPNDNLHSAGAVSSGVLDVRLVVDRGGWHPEGPDSPELEVAAFGQEGGRLQVPGPMIRVAANTQIIVTIRNRLAEPLFVHGLVTRPTQIDAVLTVPPGEARERRFMPGAPGTYHYWAATGRDTAMNARKTFDTQLGGAFVVDGQNVQNDRVFVLTEWNSRSGATAATSRRVFTINGRSWPFTEALAAAVGDTLHWRWVNLTTASHPMHLHGFYFRVTGTGSALEYRATDRDEQPEVVTQNMAVGSTMEMTWAPDRPGQWLLHCHTLFHISPDQRFWSRDSNGNQHHAGHDAREAMAGLVLGITVTGYTVADARTTWQCDS